MQMRAIHKKKKRENMAATSASRLHWHCSNLPSPTPAHQKSALGGGRGRENAAWHFSSYFMLNRPRLWTFIKVLSKEVWLEECTLFKGMHPRTSLAVTHLTLSNPQKINKIRMTRKRKLISCMKLNPVSTENISPILLQAAVTLKPNIVKGKVFRWKKNIRTAHRNKNFNQAALEVHQWSHQHIQHCK